VERTPVARDDARISPTEVRMHGLALERLAGVHRLEGRGWHGPRRLAADRAEAAESDVRVLETRSGAGRTPRPARATRSRAGWTSRSGQET
jgi:hypothetical protein